MNDKVRIIAEIGSNYNSDILIAKEYIDAAQKCGASAVKFQSLRKEKLIAPKVRIDDSWTDHPAWHNFGNLELPDKWHYMLKEHADKKGIDFTSTPFYLEAVDLLEDIGVKEYKIASGDISFFPLLEKVGKTGKPVMLSTGGSTLDDISQALNVLEKTGTGSVCLLHCVVAYPPRFDEVNLRALTTLQEAFGLPVGISDHTPGSIVPLGAVALGASVIEKHVTFDRSLPGPDHSFSMTIEEFKEMVEQIDLLAMALGTGEKIPTEDELNRQHRFRRGVYDPISYAPVDGREGLWLRPIHKKSF